MFYQISIAKSHHDLLISPSGEGFGVAWMIQSMDRKRNYWELTPMESCYGSLKIECLPLA